MVETKSWVPQSLGLKMQHHGEEQGVWGLAGSNWQLRSNLPLAISDLHLMTPVMSAWVWCTYMSFVLLVYFALFAVRGCVFSAFSGQQRGSGQQGVALPLVPVRAG